MKRFLLLLGVIIIMSDWRIISPFTADDVNECTNPQVAYATTGFSASGTNTIALSQTEQWRGPNSIKATYQNSLTLLNLAHDFLNASTTYYVKAMVFVPSDWDGGNITITQAGTYAGATNTTVSRYTAATDTKGVWLQLSTTFTLAADVSGTIIISTSSAPTAGKFVYFDAFYISTNDGIYFDGDETPGFSFWLGDRHASASQMDYRNRAHGVAYDPESTGVKFGFPTGVDFPPHENQTLERMLGRGAEYQDTRIRANAVTFVVIIPAMTEAQYHQRKKAFENLIKINRTPGKQAMVWQYLGSNADIPNCLAMRVDDFTMSKTLTGGKSGKGTLRMLVTDPAWFERGDNYAALTRATSFDVSYVLGYLNDGTGYDNLGNVGTGYVEAIAIDEAGNAYMGGGFSNWDSNANADNIVRYNIADGSWSSLFTNGAGSAVTDLLFLDDGDLIITGAFTTIGGSSLNRAARWDGSTLSGFGAGFNNTVSVVKMDYKRGILYFGGTFTTANGVTVNRIARYTLSTGVFTGMGSTPGVAGTGTPNVGTIYVDQATGDVYIGGDFDTADGVTVNNVAKWKYSTQAWQAIGSAGSPGTNDVVAALAGDDAGNIYLGGNFTQASGRTVNYVARYDIGAHIFRAMGNGLNSTVYRMVWDEVEKNLVIGGAFTANNESTLTLSYGALWNGTTFESLAFTLATGMSVLEYARSPRGDKFYGLFDAGTITVPSAANILNNVGTDETKPTIIFDSSADVIGTEYATLYYIANLNTGSRLNFQDLKLLAGSVIIIDTAKNKVYRRIGQFLEDITSGIIRRDSDITSFALEPGNNTIVVSAQDSNSTTPTITSYALWRNRHWSISGTAT